MKSRCADGRSRSGVYSTFGINVHSLRRRPATQSDAQPRRFQLHAAHTRGTRRPATSAAVWAVAWPAPDLLSKDKRPQRVQRYSRFLLLPIARQDLPRLQSLFGMTCLQLYSESFRRSHSPDQSGVGISALHRVTYMNTYYIWVVSQVNATAERSTTRAMVRTTTATKTLQRYSRDPHQTT